MSIVPVSINGKEYRLACDDGQEEQLIGLSQEVDDRMRLLSRQIPHAGEQMALLLVAITLADELGDAKRVARQLQGQMNRLEELMNQEQGAGDQTKLMEMEAAMTATLQDVASRIERIAQQLES